MPGYTVNQRPPPRSGANLAGSSRPLSRSALRVEVVSGQSALTLARAENPTKLLVPRPRGRSVWAYVSSFGGGIVAGDQTSLNVHIGKAAHCFIGSQSSTKVFRNPENRPCTHQTTARVESGGVLVFLPDPIQSFGHSHYEQRQAFDLASDGALVLLDWFCAGRTACGERWAFSHFATRNEIKVEGEVVLVDSIRLTPQDGGFESTFRTGRFNCIATLILLGRTMAPAAEAILNQISAAPVRKNAGLLCAASRIRGGVIVRMAGVDTEAVGATLRSQLGFLEDLLGDDPWTRKW